MGATGVAVVSWIPVVVTVMVVTASSATVLVNFSVTMEVEVDGTAVLSVTVMVV